MTNPDFYYTLELRFEDKKYQEQYGRFVQADNYDAIVEVFWFNVQTLKITPANYWMVIQDKNLKELYRLEKHL